VYRLRKASVTLEAHKVTASNTLLVVGGIQLIIFNYLLNSSNNCDVFINLAFLTVLLLLLLLLLLLPLLFSFAAFSSCNSCKALVPVGLAIRPGRRGSPSLLELSELLSELSSSEKNASESSSESWLWVCSSWWFLFYARSGVDSTDMRKLCKTIRAAFGVAQPPQHHLAKITHSRLFSATL
jgi:hypothetical protein